MRRIIPAGAFAGFAISATAALLAASSLPYLQGGNWPFVLGGAVFACSVGGMALSLCLRGLGELGRPQAARRERVR